MTVFGRAVELIQVPSQRLFGPSPAAKYLGVHVQTLKKMTDLGEIEAYWFRNRRVYKLEELERVVSELEKYNPSYGEDSRR
jgi:excisionase family DNA binding protein